MSNFNKDFNEFLNNCNNKDWSQVAKHIASKFNTSDFNEDMFNANTESTLTILREYHNWLNSEK